MEISTLIPIAIGAGQLYFAVKADQKPVSQTLTIEVKTKGEATVKIKVH